jgi:RNA polymerase sigma factor (sigma-70 family)
MWPDDDRSSERFWTLVRPHWGVLSGTARRLMPRDWEDLLQETLLLALRGWPGLADAERIKPWLFRILLREAQRQGRRAFWRRFRPLEEVEEPAREGGGDPHGRVLQRLHLKAALARLSPARREILLLVYFAGFPVTEAAALKGESVSAAKSRLSRARRELKGLLEGRLSLSAISKTREEELDHAFERVVTGQEG